MEDKEYDGTTKATVDTSGMSIMDPLPGDDLKVTVTGEFKDAEPGSSKTVYLTYELGGDDGDNYDILYDITPKTAKASIYPLGKGAPGEETDKGSGNGKAASLKKSRPDTGDHNDIAGLMVMMLVSGGALGAMAYSRRREERMKNSRS